MIALPAVHYADEMVLPRLADRDETRIVSELLAIRRKRRAPVPARLLARMVASRSVQPVKRLKAGEDVDEDSVRPRAVAQKARVPARPRSRGNATLPLPPATSATRRGSTRAA